jgi:hypothetical protein
MTLLSVGEEYDRALDRRPFANGHEGQSWMAAWCERCAHENTCPLLTTALLGRTPAAWTEIDPAALAGRYHCAQWRDR